MRGLYPEALLEEWDSYAERNRTDSTRPGKSLREKTIGQANDTDGFTEEQIYALIVLSDGGDDLESFRFDNSLGWVQANGVFWQIVRALASAEEVCSFEVSREERC